MLCLCQENVLPKLKNLWKYIGPAPRVFRYKGKSWVLQWGINWNLEIKFSTRKKTHMGPKHTKRSGKQKSIRKNTPQNVALPLLLVCFGPILAYFLGQPVNFRIFSFCPKFMISLYKLNTRGAGKNSFLKFWNFGRHSISHHGLPTDSHFGSVSPAYSPPSHHSFERTIHLYLTCKNDWIICRWMFFQLRRISNVSSPADQDL